MSITFRRRKMFERILKRNCSKFNSALVGSVTRASISRLVFSEGFFFFLGTPTMVMVDYPHKHNLQNQWTRHRYRNQHCKSISTMDNTLNITWSGCKSNLLNPLFDQSLTLRWWQNQNRRNNVCVRLTDAFQILFETHFQQCTKLLYVTSNDCSKQLTMLKPFMIHAFMLTR